jgi:hypothetical protein
MRRTKASLVYRRTKNLRAVQLLLGPTKRQSPSEISVSMTRLRWLNTRRSEHQVVGP